MKDGGGIQRIKSLVVFNFFIELDVVGIDIDVLEILIFLDKYYFIYIMEVSYFYIFWMFLIVFLNE